VPAEDKETEPRKRLAIRLWLVPLVAAFAALLAALEWDEYRERPYRKLREALHSIQLEVERFAVDQQGSYPNSLEALVARGKLNLPDNPFGAGKLEILKPGDPWEPGGIVYAGSGPIIAVAQMDGKQTMMGGGFSPYEPEPGVIIPTEVDQYLLIVYSPRHHPRRKHSMEEVGQGYAVAREKFEKGVDVGSFPMYAEGIDWDHVELMLTSGEDYSGDR
jgi:hypothetical protein